MRDSETHDYYHILGISPAATNLEVKGRYRALSKQHHPDMGGNQADMAKINVAYHVLSDTFRRAIYDAERKRKLRVPPRPATATQQPARTRRHTPPAQPQYTTRPKHRTNWWARFTWSLAALVIIIGLLMHLPIAEVLGNDTADIQPAAKPLDVTYKPDNSGPTSTANSTPTAASENTSYSAATPDTTSATPTTDQPKNQTCSIDRNSTNEQNCYNPSCNKESCQQVSSKKNCVTKSIGFYRHTVCSAPSGTTSCSNSIGTTYRYTECY